MSCPSGDLRKTVPRDRKDSRRCNSFNGGRSVDITSLRVYVSNVYYDARHRTGAHQGQYGS